MLVDNGGKHIQITITTGSIVKSAVLILAFLMLFYIRDLVLVVLASVVIASSFEPLTLWLGKLHISRLPAVVMTYVGFAGVIVAIFYLFLPPLLNDTSNFLATAPRYLDTISIWDPLHNRDTLGESKDAFQNFTQDLSQSQQAVQSFSSNFSFAKMISSVKTAISSLSQGFIEALTLVFGGILSSILIVVLSFYLSVQEDGVAKFLQFVTPVRQEKYVIGLWRRVQARIGLWMQGQLILAIVIGLLVYLVLAIFGPVLHVKNPILFAVLAAVCEMIPLFGPILAAIPVVSMSYTDGGLSPALFVVLAYLIIHQLENNLIYPLVVKKIVGVPPILVILGLIVGYKLAGFLGLLLAVPVATMLMEYLNDLQKDKVPAVNA